MAKAANGTYVYCLVAAPRRPSLTRVPAGLTGLGRVRLLEAGRNEWLVVADAPLDRYGEDTINSRLSDLDWVARCAVAHEAVVESFINAPAVLPMKLFTIFTSDERALDHVRRDRQHIDAVLNRVKNHNEWGIRVVLDRSRGPGAGKAPARKPQAPSGLGYLTRKKAQLDASAELAERARETVAELYDRLAAQARLAHRRLASEMPVEGGPLLLDAAFLVPTSRTTRFKSMTAREARELARHGYSLKVSGPWPPYSFIQD